MVGTILAAAMNLPQPVPGAILAPPSMPRRRTKRIPKVRCKTFDAVNTTRIRIEIPSGIVYNDTL